MGNYTDVRLRNAIGVLQAISVEFREPSPEELAALYRCAENAFETRMSPEELARLIILRDIEHHQRATKFEQF